MKVVWHKVLDSAEDLPEGRVVRAWAGRGAMNEILSHKETALLEIIADVKLI